MERRLIQHGDSSLTVTLPRRWIKENNLKKGYEVSVENLRGNLLISTKRHYEKKKVNLDVSKGDPMIRRIIGAAFKAGYDEFDVKFDSYAELDAVQKLVREQFAGFEIIKQEKHRLIVKNLSDNSFGEFDNVLRRFFLVINHMGSDFSEALLKDDFKWLRKISLLKVEVDKFADYCRRAINMGYESESFKRMGPLYTIVEEMEKVTDRYQELCLYIANNKIKVDAKIKDFVKDLVSFQENFYDLFYKFDLDKFVAFGKKKKILDKKLDSVNGKKIKVIRILDVIFNLIFNLNGPLIVSKGV